MKRIALLCVAVLLTAMPARASVLPGSQGARAPSIAMAPDGTEYVAATVGDQTLLWRDGARITPGGLFAGLPDGTNGVLATDAASDIHLARMDGTSITTTRSIDGGGTWDRGSVLPRVSHPGRVAIASSKFNSGVEGATIWMAYDSDAGVVVARSLDGGLSFSLVTIDAAVWIDSTLGNIAADPLNGDVAWLVVNRRASATVYQITPTSTSFTFGSAPDAITPAAIARAGGTVTVAYAFADTVFSFTRVDGSGWVGQELPCANASPPAIGAHHDVVIASVCDGALTTWRARPQEPFGSPQSIGTADDAGIAIAVDAGERAHIASIRGRNVVVTICS